MELLKALLRHARVEADAEVRRLRGEVKALKQTLNDTREHSDVGWATAAQLQQQVVDVMKVATQADRNGEDLFPREVIDVLSGDASDAAPGSPSRESGPASNG